MSGDAYYRTAEPVGLCSCHVCTCPGCASCDPAVYNAEDASEDEPR